MQRQRRRVATGGRATAVARGLGTPVRLDWTAQPVEPGANAVPVLGQDGAEQHLGAASVLAEDDGVRPHALSLRKGCHAPNLVKYGERRVPRVP